MRTLLLTTTSMLTLTVSAHIAMLALTGSAQAQKAIFTGGEKGAYNTTFCPPLPNVLNQSMFAESDGTEQHGHHT